MREKAAGRLVPARGGPGKEPAPPDGNKSERIRFIRHLPASLGAGDGENPSEHLFQFVVHELDLGPDDHLAGFLAGPDEDRKSVV